jgi:hypothetical protein
VSGNLRDVGGARRHRDPSGKAALFSAATAPETAAPAPSAPPAPKPSATPAHHATEPHVAPPQPPVSGRRAGTLVVDCSTCGERSRVSYVDFLLLNLPVGVWLPLPGLEYNRRMSCPACGQWTWVQAHWFA